MPSRYRLKPLPSLTVRGATISACCRRSTVSRTPGSRRGRLHSVLPERSKSPLIEHDCARYWRLRGNVGSRQCPVCEHRMYRKCGLYSCRYLHLAASARLHERPFVAAYIGHRLHRGRSAASRPPRGRVCVHRTRDRELLTGRRTCLILGRFEPAISRRAAKRRQREESRRRCPKVETNTCHV